MRRPPNPFRYVTAEHTNKPGYLAARMRMYKEKVAEEKRKRDEALAEIAKKVSRIK